MRIILVYNRKCARMTQKKVSNNGGLNLKSLRAKVKNQGILTVPQQ